MDFYINLKVNFRGNSKNVLLSGSETKSWESMEAMVSPLPHPVRPPPPLEPNRRLLMMSERSCERKFSFIITLPVSQLK